MSFSGNERDPLFINDGTGHFVDQGYAAGVDLPGDGRSGVFADLDGDGKLDLIVHQLNAPKVAVLRNDSAPDNHSLEVRAVGVHTNRMGLGVNVQACVEGTCQVREIHLGHGYLASGPAVAHFGVGKAQQVDLRITWPVGGGEVRFKQVPVDGVVTITEEAPAFDFKPYARVPFGPPIPPGLTASVVVPSVKSGTPLVVNLWAPWCKPCREEAPVLASVGAAHPGVQTLALALDPDLEKDRKQARPLGITWPVAAADATQDAALSRALDGLDLPSTLAFDASGALVGVVVGKVSPAALELLFQRAAGAVAPLDGGR
jgi:thiol-disulfide isomerase/thioredoxin